MSEGLSFLVGDDGDLVFETDADDNVTVALVEGLDEVGQALELRLRTLRFEDVLHPFDGLEVDKMVGPVSPEFISSVILREVNKDGRIAGSSARVGELNRSTRSISVQISVVLKSGAALNISEDLVF